MGSLKLQRISMMTISVMQSYSQTMNEKKTHSRGTVLGWDTKILRSFRNFAATHWQAIVGQTKLEESFTGSFLGIFILGLKKPCVAFLQSSSKKIFAASSALLLPRRSRGCLVNPILIDTLLIVIYVIITYLIADRIACFTAFSVSFIPCSSSTLVANHCLASSLVKQKVKKRLFTTLCQPYYFCLVLFFMILIRFW